MVKQIRAAIFGTGFIGRVHLDAVRRLEGVEVAALSDVNLDMVQRLGSSFNTCGRMWSVP
jgi:predicted dehydrogenase